MKQSSNLPDLPRVLNQHEQKFSERFAKWIDEHAEIGTASMEMKDTKGRNYLPFASVEPQQVNYALRISSPRGAFIRVIGTSGQPDYVLLRNAPAWIVIHYPEFFCLVSIGNWEHEKSYSKKKSLSSDRALQIATIVVEL